MNATQQSTNHPSKNQLPRYRVWNDQGHPSKRVVQTPYGPCGFSMESSVHSGYRDYSSYVGITTCQDSSTTHIRILAKFS